MRTVCIDCHTTAGDFVVFFNDFIANGLMSTGKVWKEIPRLFFGDDRTQELLVGFQQRLKQAYDAQNWIAPDYQKMAKKYMTRFLWNIDVSQDRTLVMRRVWPWVAAEVPSNKWMFNRNERRFMKKELTPADENHGLNSENLVPTDEQIPFLRNVCAVALDRGLFAPDTTKTKDSMERRYGRQLVDMTRHASREQCAWESRFNHTLVAKIGAVACCGPVEVVRQLRHGCARLLFMEQNTRCKLLLSGRNQGQNIITRDQVSPSEHVGLSIFP
jgi:hypothetical protein